MFDLFGIENIKWKAYLRPWNNWGSIDDLASKEEQLFFYSP